MTEGVLEILEACREREREQTRFYRLLAAAAEGEGDEAAAERLNALLADEHHHLSRLTARVLELQGVPRELPTPPLDPPAPEGWEEGARAREEEEVAWYTGLLSRELDSQTRELIREILASEEIHARELGGKWMSA